MSELQISHLTKEYGTVCALQDVSVNFGENKIYGLLGRNGAGKTTLLNLICSRLFPTQGEIRLDGKPVQENEAVLQDVFCMTEQQLYPEAMKVRELFRWIKEFYPTFDQDYAWELARKFGLKTNRRLNELSTGYSTIVKLILALAVNTPFVLYDEPVLGLDANHRELFYRELLDDYMKRPKTVIISTHIIEEVSDLLEHVIILKGSRIAVDDAVENVLKRAYCVSGPQAAVEAYAQGRKCIGFDRIGAFASAALLEEKTEEGNREIARLGLETSAVELQKLFIYLTNGEEEVEA